MKQNLLFPIQHDIHIQHTPRGIVSVAFAHKQKPPSRKMYEPSKPKPPSLLRAIQRSELIYKLVKMCQSHGIKTKELIKRSINTTRRSDLYLISAQVIRRIAQIEKRNQQTTERQNECQQ